ncbi:MAG: phage portal protein [Gemmatimonadales bacterium]|nr:MAG: phage portal protein [Gemmatimonadales bacterium]
MGNSTTRIDRMISYFSPTRGARRLAARRMIESLSYEGARKGRREDGWIVGVGTSANTEISTDRLSLRDRVRTLRRNNPYAAKAISVLVSNRIGTGILTSADGKNRRENARTNERWERWIERCDYTGRTDYYGIQSLSEGTRIESGECFIRFLPAQSTEPGDVPFRLQVLEPDHLDTAKNETRGDISVAEGIGYRNGLPVEYWMFPSHPGDHSPILTRSSGSVRIPARDVIHYYRTERPGQRTGVTELAPVIRRLYDLEGYGDAELMRKKIAACSIGAVTTAGGLPGESLAPTSTGGDGRQQEQFSPGMWHYFKPGEDVKFFDPSPSDGYREFFGVELHAIAAGLRMPFELLTGDLSEVNYTSHRGGLVQFRGMVEADQWQMLIPQICQPVWDRFISELEMRPGARVPAKFTPPRFGLLDPAKEIPAMIQAIQGGLQSWTDTIRREGENPDMVLEEIAAERSEFEKRGINITSIVKPVTNPMPPTESDNDGVAA